MQLVGTGVYMALLAALCLESGSLGQDLTATPSSPPSIAQHLGPNAPSDVPVVGDYRGRYRPQVHFSPPKNFMNDPNGMFRDENGTWHLYYQYNPTQNKAGNQHWGHATSQDLYHWTNQPIALFPPRKNVYIFSGSAVIDRDNTSGFFRNKSNGVVAIYTLAEYLSDGSPGPQSQAIAYSYDGGFTFIPYDRNPVLDSNSSQFRDPKVVWYQDHWVMVVAYAQEFSIGIFTSPNLIDWTHASNFSHHGLLGLQWECPNLVRMPFYAEDGQRQDDMWTMLVSINPGAPVGGSITEYFPGTFNGTHFEAADSAARIADFGKDNYAGQFFFGVPDNEDPVSMAWASNWQYTQTVPTGQEDWRSAMSLPRRNHLKKLDRVGWKLVSSPFDMQPIMGETLAYNQNLGNEALVIDFSGQASNAIYWEVNVTGLPKSGIPEMATVNFTLLSPTTAEYVRGGYYFGGDTPFYLDRGGAKGFDDVFFTDKFSTNSLFRDNSWSMSGVMDRSILELFLNGGVDSATTTFFATQPLKVLELAASNLPHGARASARVNVLKSSWQEMEDTQDGLVHGNKSMPVQAQRHGYADDVNPSFVLFAR
ncbi:invertase precursor [Metarhizium rileyi]|uniref:Invertase n=1 Tax=Metarhizium rileyi (strain RCEF 4871) TaxID=1649241 RepID=A0A167G4Z3_METRR|nr:invertase precursor [Metarhizium rileyi RCEF 4871]